MHNSLRNIVILGGGTAGWMAAALLGRMLEQTYQIKLVESDEIATVGVGEATLPHLQLFHSMLGIDQAGFMRATNATFKLGIQFEDWSKIGKSYFHPFGRYGDDFDLAPFHQYWLRTRLDGSGRDIDKFSLCAQLAAQNKFALPGGAQARSVWSTLGYAFHLDASLYARYLRGVAEAAGVVRHEGRCVKVDVNADTGFVTRLHLQRGEQVEGDFFIDCSGFQSLLLGKTLNVGYESWKHWLPCDSALAAPCSRVDALTPYTRSIAESAGWRWRIPLQNRIGNGHVYASGFMGESEAESVFLRGLEAEPLREPLKIKFEAGHRTRIWEKNVVALGLSSGFIEPLESTSIHLIQTGLARLINWFPSSRFDNQVIAQYNRLHIQEMEKIRDFIILHYCLGQRQDSEFWRYLRNMSLPESLGEKISLFKASGKLVDMTGEFFKEASWLAVLLGQDAMPDQTDPIAALYPKEKLQAVLAQMGEIIFAAAQTAPSHQEFIDHYCKAPLVAG